MNYLDGLEKMLPKPLREHREMLKGLLLVGLLFDARGNVAQLQCRGV